MLITQLQAALFSAILTAFIVEVYKLLQPDPQDVATDLLRNISATLQGSVSQSISKPPFSPSRGYIWVNGFWFASLTCSLGTAMLVLLIKQWLQFYSIKLWSGTSHQYAKRRQYRYNALQKWHVAEIISALPLLLHTAVMLFAVGLIIMLHQINSLIANIVTGMVTALLFVYGLGVVLPLLYNDCPYRSSGSVILKITCQMLAFYLRWLIEKLLSITKKFLPQPQPLLANSSVRTNIVSGFKSSLSDYKSISDITYYVLEPGNADDKSLDQDTILWLASSSQDPAVIEKSLAAVVHLPHTSDLVEKLIGFNIMPQLAKKALVPLPPREEILWKKIPGLTSDWSLMIELKEAAPYMLSLLRIWSHPAYVIIPQLPAISMAEKDLDQTHAWLLGDWIRFWRILRHQSNNEALLQNGWDIETFILLVCTEAMYYQRYTQRQTLPRLSKVTGSFNLDEPNPLHDLYEVIEDQYKYHLNLSEHSLACVFNVFKQVLAGVELAQNTDFEGQTLLLLVQSWRKHHISTLVSHQVLLCIKMLLLKSIKEKKAYIANDPRLNSSQALQVFIALVEYQLSTTQTEPRIQVDIISLAAWEIYNIMQNDPSLGYRYHGIIFKLPVEPATVFITQLLKNEVQKWKNQLQLTWFLDFVISWVSQGTLSNAGSIKLLFCLQDVLESLQHWKDLPTLPMINKITSFLVNQLEDGYATEKLLILCDILKNSVKNLHGLSLKVFMSLNGPVKITNYIQANNNDSPFANEWKSLIWDVKKILARSTDAKKSGRMSNETHQLLIELDEAFSQATRPEIQSQKSQSQPSTTQLPPDQGHLPESESTYLLSTHKDNISAIAFSPNGKIVVTGSWNTSICFWNAETHALIGDPMYNHAKGVTCVAFSHDGKLVASGGEDGSVCIWDVDKQKNIHHTIEEHSEAISSVAFPSNGKQVLSGSWANTISLYDLSKLSAMPKTLLQTHNPVTSIDVSPSGTLVVAGLIDNNLNLWNTETKELMKNMTGHDDFITAVTFVDDRYFISSSWDRSVRMWDIQTGTSIVWRNAALLKSENQQQEFIPLATSPDGQIVASTLQKEFIYTVMGNAVNSAKHMTFKGHQDLVTALALSPWGSHIASGSQDKSVRIWSIRTGTQIAMLEHNSEITSLAYSHDGQLISSGSKNGWIYFWNAKNAVHAPNTTNFTASGGPIQGIAFSTDNKSIATIVAGGTIQTWDIATGKAIAGPFTSHPGPPASLMFSTDNKYILSCSSDGVVCIWDIEGKECVKKLVNVLDKI